MRRSAPWWTTLVAVLLAGGAVVGCTSSSPSPSPGRTTSEAQVRTQTTCAFGDALFAPGSALFRAADSYELADLRTGAVRYSCRPAGEALYRYAMFQQRPSFAGAAAPHAPLGVEASFDGDLRPGGADHAQVPVDAGALDLRTGHTQTISYHDFHVAAIGRTQAVLVRNYDHKAQPTQPKDWCVVPLTGSGGCVAVPGARGAGSPTIAADGSVRWSTNDMTKPSLAGRDGPVYVRQVGDRITDLGVRSAAGDYVYFPSFVSAAGNGFLVPFEQTALDRPIRWYGVTSQGRRSTLGAHQASTTWAELAQRTGIPPAMIQPISTLLAGSTLYLFFATGGGVVTVEKVTDGGAARPLFARQSRIEDGAELIYANL